MEDTDLSWRKSSYSGNGGATCVEVGESRDGMVAVRDTTDCTGPVLTFTSAGWRRFAEQVKRSLATDLGRRSWGAFSYLATGDASFSSCPGTGHRLGRRLLLCVSARAGFCRLSADAGGALLL